MELDVDTKLKRYRTKKPLTNENRIQLAQIPLTLFNTKVSLLEHLSLNATEGHVRTTMEKKDEDFVLTVFVKDLVEVGFAFRNIGFYSTQAKG